jgi:sulfate transport system ATP-binding protein
MGIRVENLTKRFGSFVAVEDASFDIPTGELVALLGPSGGGKSTILRIIAGLERADSGSVYLDDQRVDHLHPRARRVGFVFQHYALFRHMTVFENIAFGLQVQRVPKTKREARVRELLRIMGLEGLDDRYPSQLSGGQRQRVALARSLAPEPRLLLLDEPFGAVDAKVREELRRWLRRMHEQIHVTSIFVTHDQEEAFAVADRVMIIHRGRLEQQGSPSEILDEPANEFVARFVGEVNVFDSVVREGLAEIGPVRVPVREIDDGTPTRLVVRCYDIRVWRAERGVATVTRLLSFGDRVKVEGTIDGGATFVAIIPRRSNLLTGVEVGCRADLEISHARAYPVTSGI